MRLAVNGEDWTVPDEPERSLLHVLREELRLTAAKDGCGEGACGACTVLLDGRPIRSCVRPIAEVAGRDVRTLEGLRDEPVGRALAEAFVDAAAFQCGYCTPGMLVAANALLRDEPAPDPARIRAALDGNLCRCGVYQRIVRAVEAAAGRLRTEGGGDAWAARAAPEQRPADAVAATSHAAVRPEAGADTPARRPARPWDLTAVEDRDVFERLGDGLLVVLEPADVERLDGGAVWSSSGGAWLHVGADGTVTAFSGKVDVGQGNRTALRILVAGELGARPDRVTLVMGDTDLCPYDEGTFGSRSIADAGRVLRTVAAAARRWLVAAAAARMEIAPDELEIAGGTIVSRDHARSLPLEAVVHGRRATERARPDEALRGTAAWRIAAQGSRRDEARAIVAGAARFGSDLERPGMLHGRVLHPPAMGTALQRVDAERVDAARRAGQDDVVVLLDGTFAGVAAPHPNRAEDALGLLAAEWSEPAGPGDREVDAYLRDHPAEASGWQGRFEHATGDVDAALRSAALTLEARYSTAYIAHVPAECRVALAEWDAAAEPRLTVWTGTQRPFGVREQLAGALGVDEARIRVVVPPTGSGFGGKHDAQVAIEAARLARAAGCPVKVRWSRHEELTAAYLRPAAAIDVRSGIDADGRLSAWAVRTVNAGPNALLTPYVVANQRLEYQPAESPLAQGSYRGLAATANCFAREAHMDELAARAGLDPLEFRLRHLADERLAEVLRRAAAGIGWGEPLPTGTGLGLALGLEKGGRVATAVRLGVDGGDAVRLERLVTVYDCGAIVDPDGLASQVEGATVMALGGALFERVIFAGGRITNGSLTDYRVPRFSDVPAIDVDLVDRPDAPPAGAGETPIIAVAPAIANAIGAATGRRIRALPLVPDGRLP